MKRYRRITLLSLLLVLLGPPIPLLLYTETGLTWLFQIATRVTPGQLSVERLQGSLSAIISFENLRYQNENMDIKLQKGQLHWHPERLFGGLLRIDQLTLDGIWIKTTDNDNQQPSTELPQIDLPLRLSLESINFNHITIAANGSEDFNIKMLHFSANTYRDYIVIPWLITELQDYSLTLHGKLKPQQNYPLDAVATVKINQLFSEPLLIESQLKGDLQQLATETNIQGFVDGILHGTVFDVANDLRWQANAVVNKLGLHSFSKDLPTNNISGRFQSQGSIDSFTLIGDANSNYSQWGDIVVSYDLILAGSELIVNNMVVKEKTNPAILTGQGGLNWHGEEVEYDLAADWQNLAWPWQATPIYKSSNGRATILGPLSDYKLQLDTELEMVNYPVAKILAIASGDLAQLQIHDLAVDVLQGKILGQTDLQWQEGLQWQAKLDFQQLNPAPIINALPGKITGKFHSNGQLVANDLLADMRLFDVTGKLQNIPLNAFADVMVKNKHITINQLALNLDGTDLNASGDITEQFNLDYSLQTDNLSVLLPDAVGMLTAQGKLSGKLESPQLQLALDAKNVSYQAYAFNELESDVNVSLEPAMQSNLLLNVSGIQVNEQKIESLQVKADGTIDNHQVMLNAKQQTNSFNLKLAGGLFDETWQGRWIDSELHSQDIGNWRLEKSSELILQQDLVSLEKNCFFSQQATLCFAAEYVAEKLAANVEWNNLSIDTFSAWLPQEMQVRTFFNGTAKLDYQRDKMLLNAVNTNTAGEVVVAVDDETHQIKFGKGKTTIDWNPTAFVAKSLLPLEKDAKIDALVKIEQKDRDLDFSQQALSGELAVKVPSLVLLTPYISSIRNLEQANAAAQFTLAGNLSQPIIVGKTQANATQLLIPELNISLNDLKFDLAIDDQQRVTFTGKVSSGRGDLQTTGEFQLDKAFSLHGHSLIEGKNFVAVDLPESTVHLNPKLTVNIQKHKISVEGDLTVPYARLRPSKLPVDAVAESADVMIVDDDRKPQATTESQWQSEVKVRLILGDRVSFDGFGLRSRLVGSLQLVDKPDTVTVGRGEIQLIDGDYSSYGQELEISRGRFLFANTPIDDPGLDVRAHRTVGDIIVGIEVTSTLRNPEIRLFSNPIMAETDALSYLLLGRPLQQADQGEGTTLMTAATAMGLAGSELLARSIGNRLGIDEVLIETDTDAGTSSLVIGRYLSPRLYIRYFTGIFERSNIVQLRYDLGKKVVVQTETGSQMGADIFYTIEH